MRNRHKSHAIADAEKAQAVAVRSEHREWSAPEQPPAAGRFERIDAGLVPSNTHAASRNFFAGRWQALGRWRIRRSGFYNKGALA